MKITVETSVAAPIAQVWRAYTTPEDIKQWNAASADWHTTAATVDLRAGGAFSSRMEAKDGSMGFDFAGTYTKIVEHKLIEYTFGDRTAQVTFTPGPQGVKVAVTFESEDDEFDRTCSAAAGRRSSTTSPATSRRSEGLIRFLALPSKSIIDRSVGMALADIILLLPHAPICPTNPEASTPNAQRS